jgi:hypothetical protein
MDSIKNGITKAELIENIHAQILITLGPDCYPVALN